MELAKNDLETYPNLYGSIHSIRHYLKTQDIDRMVLHTSDPERGKLAVVFVQDRLEAISHKGRKLTRHNGDLSPDVKVCRAIENLIVKFGDDPDKHISSMNPVTSVIARWASMEKVLDDILTDLDKAF